MHKPSAPDEQSSLSEYAVIEHGVELGPGCVVRPFAHLVGPLVMGSGNHVYAGAVLGERPQHLGYRGEATRLEIGDQNVFREHVTVHQGTAQREVTRIASRNVFMPGSHVAHDCIVGSDCVLGGGALLGGHCTVDDGSTVGANAAVHQYCWIGRLSVLESRSCVTKDVPPFMVHEGTNRIRGVNAGGLRRAGVCAEAVEALQNAYRWLFLEQLSIPSALARIEADSSEVPEIGELLRFVRTCSRGIRRRSSEVDG
jgi:UDP-N-acetylglucosamine acyltransferase